MTIDVLRERLREQFVCAWYSGARNGIPPDKSFIEYLVQLTLEDVGRLEPPKATWRKA